MPLKVNAGQVKETYQGQATDRVERLVAGEIGEVKQLMTQALRATEKAVDEYFAAQDAAGQSPYPTYHSSYRQLVATVTVDFRMSDAQRKLISDRGSPVLERISSATRQLLTDAGFTAAMNWINTDVPNGGGQFIIWDPEFRPIDEGSQANTLFEQRVKEQRP